AHLVVRRDAASGTQGAEALGGRDDLFAQVLQVTIQAGLIRNRKCLRAAHRDRLEVLRAHDRAQAGPTDRPAVFTVHHDRGVADLLFTGRANTADARLLSAQARAADLLASRIVCL